MNTIYKLKDIVFHHEYGQGEVVKINPQDLFPIVVKFSGSMEITFGPNGQETAFNKTSVLSFTPYTLEGFSQERPKPEIEKGQVIYFKKKNDFFWSIGLFVRITTELLFVDHGAQGDLCMGLDNHEYSIDNPLHNK